MDRESISQSKMVKSGQSHNLLQILIIVGTQKISNLFIVQFKKGYTDAPFSTFGGSQVVKKGGEGPRDNASLWIFVNWYVRPRLAGHRMGLSGSGLTVGEHGAVIPLKKIMNESRILVICEPH